MVSFWKNLRLQAKKTSIGGIKFIFESETKLERIFWTSIITLGLVVVTITIRKQVNSWNSRPIAQTITSTKVENIPYPAITFCHPGWNKFGLMEHLINMMDPSEAHEKFS